MAQSRTAKGTAFSKTSSTTLTLAGVVASAGRTIVVGVAWEDGGLSDKPAVQWGNKDMAYIVSSEDQRGDTVVRMYKFRVKKDTTQDITITWTNAKVAKAMFATQIVEASIKDVQSTNNQAATTTPATGVAVTTTAANTLHVAAFAMIGPTTDAAATANIGHTIGQRTGTSGGLSTSNVTLQETYEILTVTGDCRATLTLTTARPVASSIVAFEATQAYTVSAAWYEPFDGFPDQEAVVFVMEDESNADLFRVRLPRREFEEMSDTEVEDYIKNRCQWRADKDYDGAPSPDFTPDAAFNSRVSSFVNDTFTI